MSEKSNLDKSQFILFTILVLFAFICSIIIYSGWVSQRYQEQVHNQLLERARLLASQYIDYEPIRPYLIKQNQEQFLYRVKLVSLQLAAGANTPDSFELPAMQRLYAGQGRQEVFANSTMPDGMQVFRYLKRFQTAGKDNAVSIILSTDTFLRSYRDYMRSLIIFSTFILVLTTISTALLLRWLINTTFDLDAKNEALVRLENFKDEMTSMLIHDLKNPLTVVIGSLAMMKGGMMGLLSDTQKNLITLSKDSADRLLIMILNILDIAKLKEGKMELKPAEIDLSIFLQKVVNKYNEIAARDGKIVSLAQSFSRPTLKADENILDRVLDNLIGNALKHTLKDKGKIEISAQPDSVNNSVKITVRDNGEGIPAEYLDKVFDEYVQVYTREMGTKLDTGLGLTFCRLAIEAMGGRIWAESKPGEGATFYFTIPQPA